MHRMRQWWCFCDGTNMSLPLGQMALLRHLSATCLFCSEPTVWKFLISRLTSCSANDTLVWLLYLYRSSWEELEFSVPSCMWLEVGDYCVLGMVSVDMSSNRVTTTTMSVQDMETMEVSDCRTCWNADHEILLHSNTHSTRYWTLQLANQSL